MRLLTACTKAFFVVFFLSGNLSFCAQDFPTDPLQDPSHLSFWIFWDCATKGDCKFDPSRPTERYFVFVNGASGSDSAAGTRADPLKTIAAGIIKAASNGKRAVAGCAGTYSENALILSLPVSLYGSYDCASWGRTPTYGYGTFDGTNATILQAGSYSASNTATLTITGGNISRTVAVDGFDIQGAASGGSGSIGIKITNSASPAIQNNQIDGGTATGTSVAVAIDFASPYIAQNSITGGNGSTQSRGLSLGAGANPTIESNSIDGGGSPASYGMYASAGGAGTIQNNTSISGGTGGITYGIYATDSGTNLNIYTNTFITGGTASTGRAHGILITSSATATISGNSRILAGTSTTDNTYGIYVQNGAGATIQNNTIEGGNANSYSLGIEVWNTNTPVTIEKNRIHGGYAPAASASLGVNLNTSTSGTLVRNNFIHGGVSPGGTRGLQIWATGGNIKIYNNTILAGNNATAQTSAIYVGGSGTPPDIRNNILFCANGAPRYGLYEGDATSEPGIFQNNNIFDCTTALYLDENSTNLTAASAINSLTDMTTGGNVSVDMVGGPAYFSSVDGTDGNIDTMADNDWSLLSSTPASITQGGLDLSGLGVTDDFFSVPRTPPFSIGAYELDN